MNRTLGALRPRHAHRPALLCEAVAILLSGGALFPAASASAAEPQPAPVERPSPEADKAPKRGTSEANSELEQVVITAQRRADPLLRVPASVSAMDARTMDRQGVRSIGDIAALTPGVDFQTQSFGAGAGNFIAIRGIMSGNMGVTGGNTADTTGIYIDDTPIQGRKLNGQYSGNAFPQVFDLDRVEVLRGPQGTLWGSGSEGGAVRFITPEPGFKDAEGHARFEVSQTQGGDPSYELGVAYGAPIVKDQLGFRLSAWSRKEGGFVDRVGIDAAGNFDGTVLDRRSNHRETQVFSAAVGYKPSADVVVTPSVFYQNSKGNDSGSYWVHLSSPQDGVLRNGNRLSQPYSDRFVLPALKVEVNLGGARLVNAISYFRRDAQADNDYTSVIPQLIGMSPYNAPTGASARSISRSGQNNFVEEVHLESTNLDSRLSWIAGLFYSDAKQVSNQMTGDTGVTAPVTLPPQYLGQYDYYGDLHTRDRQLALFGEASYQLTEKLKATLGLRFARVSLDFDQFQAGSFVGPAPNVDKGKQQESPVTPKLGLSYQAAKDTMFYATASKGYRVGGVNGAVGPGCGDALAMLGLSSAPPTFSSDEVLSYELGAKTMALNNRVAIEASVFHTDWNRIQQSVTLSCGYPITFNAGKAVSQGFDLTLRSKFGPLQFTQALGYTDAYYTQDVGSGVSTLIRSGMTLGVAPWTSTTALQYNFSLAQRSAYLRADYMFRSHNKGVSQRQDPAAPTTYDPAIPLDPLTRQLNLRGGVTLDVLDGLDVALFVQNATNERPELSLFHTTPASSLYTAGTVRPRTIGMTMSTRF